MEITEGTITENYGDYKVENMLFTYDENEIEQNKINKNNAGLLFTPKFIPFYPRLLEKGLTINESLVFGFIDFYLQNSSDKFYFTNEQIGKLFGFGEQNTSLIIKKLKEKGFIDTSYRLKANGGKIRFIKNLYSDYKNFYSPTIKKFIDNNNKINNNKINIYENQKQENTQEHLNSFPKQDITDDAHHSRCDLTNYDFDTFWKEFPHARKGKKKESEQYFNKQDADLVKKQVGILNFKINAGLQDAQFIPACERRIRDFTPISDVVLKQELLKIARWHLNAGGDIKARAKQLKETFGEDAINEAVKTIQQKDSPKNLFINK